MDKIRVEICVGTTCHVLGGGSLHDLEDHLPSRLRDQVEVVGAPCLKACENGNYGDAPFVKINGEIMAAATIDKIIARLNRL